MAIANWDDVEGVVADFAIQCEIKGVELETPLGGREYQRALEQMRSLPRLMESGSYNQVLAQLKEMSSLGRLYRTRFAEEAERMEGELLEGLETVVGDLEALHEGAGEASAQGLAQDLLPGLTDTPFASRVEVLCQ